MRKFVAMAIAMNAILITASAQASKVYSEETCRAQVARGHLVELYADTSQSSFIIRDRSRDFDLDALYKRRKGEKPTGREDVVLEVLNEAKVSKKKYADGCFSGEVASYDRKVIVNHASQAAHSLLGLKEGQKIVMRCRVESVEPSDACEASANPTNQQD